MVLCLPNRTLVLLRRVGCLKQNNQLLNIPNWTTGKVSQTETEDEEEEGEKEEQDNSGGFPHNRDTLCC